MTLDETMNQDIDRLIARLQAARDEVRFLRKVETVREAQKNCEGFVFYWDEKLNKLMDSL